MKRQVNPLLQTLQASGLSEKKARALLQKLRERIAIEVMANGKLRWPDLGVFHLTATKMRQVCNPQTKQLMTLPQTARVRFRASKSLRQLVNR